MSLLIYNGVSIPYIHTQKVEQECVKDPSGTDVLYWRFVIRVEGVIGVKFDKLYRNHLLAGGPNAKTPAAIAKNIRHDLMAPRRPLQFEAGGEILVEVKPTPPTHAPFAGAAIDAKNGPNPLYCNVKPVATASFLVEYGIECWIVDCGQQNIVPPSGQINLDQLLFLPENQKPWVSNRWSESVTLDDTGSTRERTRRGLLITRSDMFVTPDQLRGLVAPPLARGFRRVKSRYSMSEDGLSLAYEFTDEEVWLAPPLPAYKAEGTYSEGVQEGVGKRYGEVYVRLTGSKASHVPGGPGGTFDKADLLDTAIAVAMGKINPQLERKNGLWTGTITIEEELYDNVVSVRVRALLRPGDARHKNLWFSLRNFNEVPLAGTRNPEINNENNPAAGDDQLCRIIGTRGTAGVILIAAKLRDPCLRQNIERLVNQVNEGNGGPQMKPDPGQNPALSTPYTFSPSLVTQTDPSFLQPVEVEIHELVPDDHYANYSDEVNGSEDVGIYSKFVVHKSHIQKENVIMLPVCKRGDESPGSTDDPEEHVVQIAPPSHRLEVRFITEKLGRQPQIPDPRPVDPNMVLLHAEVEPVSVETAADGVSIRYTVNGKYIYGFKNWRNAKINAALPPWMKDEPTSYNRPFILSNDIISPTGIGEEGMKAKYMFGTGEGDVDPDPYPPPPIFITGPGSAGGDFEIGPGGNSNQT